MKKIRDHFFYKAKRENFKARSIYKLEEIQKKYKCIKKRQVICDIGCAPGSWLQYISKLVGPAGKVIGIDIKELEGLELDNMEFHKADIFSFDFSVFNYWFDGITSDAAPNTTGIKGTDSARSFALIERAVEISEEKLKKGGFFIGKFLQGVPLGELRNLVKPLFQKHAFFKPASSRKESSEIFIIAQEKH
ncbi:SAM-dependent methyltransferase [Spirochaetota bacterium]